jgi:hypothetical protein
MPTLESYCSALRKNDTSITDVDTEYFDEGYGNELGALRWPSVVACQD